MIDPIELDSLFDDVDAIEATSVPEWKVAFAWASLTDFMTRARLAPVAQAVDHTVIAAWMRWAATREPEHRSMCNRIVGPITPHTIAGYLYGIKVKLARSGMTGVIDHPLVGRTLRKLKRGTNHIPRQARPLTNDLVQRIVEKIDDERLADVRHRAMLLLGRASAVRSSELCSTRMEDIRIDEHGMVITIWFSKTNKTKKPEYVCIPRATEESLCAVRATEKWLARTGITEGYLFRPVHFNGNKIMGPGPLDPRLYNLAVKSIAHRIGEDPTPFSGYSTRRGFATTASRSDEPLSWIGDRLRHRKGSQVTERYIDDDDSFGGVAALL